ARLPDQHDYLAGPDRRGVHQPGAAAKRSSRSLRIRGRAHLGDGLYRRHLLFARRALWRASRSQHTLLEIAAGLRPHHGPVKARHSNRGPAAALLCDHRGYASDHAAVELRSTDGKRPENRDTMDTGVPLPRLAGALLSPYNRAWPLVRAHLRLASVGVSLVSACTIHLGLLTSICDLCGREDC